MNRTSKLLTTLALLLSFGASGCSLLTRWKTPEVWAKQGQVLEIRERVVIPVVVREGGKLKKAHYVAEKGCLVGLPPALTEVK